jgi:hypothetical protein
VIVCELNPSILATGFLFVLAAPGLGAPWIDLGSFIKLGSNFAGVRPVAAPLFVSVGNLAESGVAAADRHRWSDESDKKFVLDFEENIDSVDFPRLRFDRMISSKSLMLGSSPRVASRSWMNSLNICVWRSMCMYSESPCGTLLRKASMLKWYMRPDLRDSPEAGWRYLR